MDFTNKAVVVTGSAVGIGRATAVAFAAAGAKVAVNYSSSEQEAASTLDQVKKAGAEGIAVKADVSNEADADRLVQTAVDAFGKVDVLVNNAGITRFISFNDLEAATAEVWQKLYAVNVMGAFFCARAAARDMRKRKSGVIVNLCSVSGHRPQGSAIPYCASKAALLHLTKCLAVTLGPDIRVNSVSPGFVDTRWHEARTPEQRTTAREAAAKNSIAKRVGRPEDIAAAVLYLASEGAAFSTGADLLVDGGRCLS